MKVRGARHGAILVVTLWIIAILAVLFMGIGRRLFLEWRLGRYYLDEVGARYLAQAGTELASDLLQRSERKYDTLYECGVTFKDEQGPEEVLGRVRTGEVILRSDTRWTAGSTTACRMRKEK